MRNRVLILLPNDKLGGAEQHLKNIASYYLDRGSFVEVRFLTKEKTKSWRDLKGDFRLIFTHSHTEKAGLVFFLKSLISNKGKSYDYLFTSHVHLTGLGGLLISLNLLKIKYFVGRESTSIFKRFTGLKLFMFKTLYKSGYHKLDLLICQTDYMKQQLVKALPRLSSRIDIKTISNPINIENIKTDDGDFEFRNQNYIVSAGRLITEKGYDVLIRAFASITDRFPDLKLVILGEGEERVKLESLSKDLGVFEKVFLVGFKNNVYTYFRYARVCVVSSRIEGFPNVLLQMMSQNNAIVSTLCAGGIDEIPSIYTCEPDNVEKLADQVGKVLVMDNVGNRELFDTFLSRRSVPGFVEQINQYLNV